MLPMKDKLSPADAHKMVAFVRAFQSGKQSIQVGPRPPLVPPPPSEPRVVTGPKIQPGPAKGPPAPSQETAARMRVATVLYRQYCLVCHGGEGRAADMRASMPAIPDFSSPAWQASLSNAQRAASILDGKGTFMPAFRGRVDDEQAQVLAAYVRAFGPARAAATEPPAGDFERRFQELENQWDELQKQLQELSKTRRQP
jgi:mono/diheme cytochrome c family protein